MPACSVAYDLISRGYDDWWFPAFGLIAAALAAGILMLFNFFPEKIVSASARKGMVGAIFLALIWAVITFGITYTEYLNLRQIYQRGEYKVISGNIEHLADSGPTLQPGTERFSVGNITF